MTELATAASWGRELALYIQAASPETADVFVQRRYKTLAAAAHDSWGTRRVLQAVFLYTAAQSALLAPSLTQVVRDRCLYFATRAQQNLTEGLFRLPRAAREVALHATPILRKPGRTRSWIEWPRFFHGAVATARVAYALQKYGGICYLPDPVSDQRDKVDLLCHYGEHRLALQIKAEGISQSTTTLLWRRPEILQAAPLAGTAQELLLEIWHGVQRMSGQYGSYYTAGLVTVGSRHLAETNIEECDELQEQAKALLTVLDGPGTG